MTSAYYKTKCVDWTAKVFTNCIMQKNTGMSNYDVKQYPFTININRRQRSPEPYADYFEPMQGFSNYTDH